MALSRRRLLQAGFAGVLSSYAHVGGLGFAGQVLAAPQKEAGGWFSRTSYTSLVGTPFSVGTGAGRRAPLTLTAVGDITPPDAIRAVETLDGRFSLTFTSAARFPQGTYPFRHAALGDATLFVVPFGQSATPHYEVIVNRLT